MEGFTIDMWRASRSVGRFTVGTWSASASVHAIVLGGYVECFTVGACDSFGWVCGGFHGQ